jgi:hypothetical protein
MTMTVLLTIKDNCGIGFVGEEHTLIVSVRRAPHLLCCRTLEVRKYACAPDALHLRHPVNAYFEVG